MKQQVEHVIKGLIVILIFGLASCSRCEDCDLNGNVERICEAEFDSRNQYENAVADREAQGATCTSAAGF